MKRLFLAAILTLLLVMQARGDNMKDARPKLMIGPRIELGAARITLGSIAAISNHYPEFEKLVNDLRSVDLGEAPPPSMSTTLPGVKILSAIEQAGIPLDSFGYVIPQAVIIERQGHTLTPEEILPHVREKLHKDSDFDLQVRELNWSNSQVVPAGRMEFDIERLGRPESGRVPLRILVNVDGEAAARFMATAVVDDWREVPVLNKSVERGMLISPEDVEVVRMNLFKQPPNVADKVQQVVGRRAKQRLAAGDTIKKSAIDIPPIIPAGRSVTLLYRSGGFEATATGTALEDGFENSDIRVRNDSSKKAVKARVVSAEQVEVSAQ